MACLCPIFLDESLEGNSPMTDGRKIVRRALRCASFGPTLFTKQQRMLLQRTQCAENVGNADIHMHSTFSDGIGTIAQILHHVEHNTNLDVIALTDHDVIEGALRARDLWKKGHYRFDFIVGEEISTREGHMLALFIEKRIEPGLSLERSIDLVHEQGGLAIIAHPLNPIFRHSCQREALDRIYVARDVWLDGIETWNASFCGIGGNSMAMNVNREVYGWPEVGNSDAHTLGAIGRGRTWFEGSNARDLRAALEAGQTTSSGRLWSVDDYLKLAHHHVSKRAQSLQSRAA